MNPRPTAVPAVWLERLRDALLADRTADVTAWLAGGGDPNAALDRHGGAPLHYACTPRMVQLLLDGGADPRIVRPGGTSTLDAAAIEGQTEMVRILLRAAPELASEERALLAADHPETEALIRAVARGESVDSIPVSVTKRLTLRPIPTSYDPAAPSVKGAQRYHSPRQPDPAYPGELRYDQLPDWARPHVPEGATTFAGPDGSVLVFDDEAAPVLVTRDGVQTIDAPPVRFPYEHGYDASGRYFFFGYRQAHVVGVDLESGKSIVDLKLPGAPWGTAVIGVEGEDLRGHSYPVRLAVVDNWLVVVSLERIQLVPFGAYADQPGLWYTCQLGTCVAPVLGGRIVVVGARSGGVVFGVNGPRMERLADFEPPASIGPGPLQGHLRMALLVSDQGISDLRRIAVLADGEDTIVLGFGLAGMETGKVRIRGLTVDPDDAGDEWPTAPEITDVFELDGQVQVRVSPIGRSEVRSYALEGLEALWDKAFVARTPSVAAAGPGLVVTSAPLPRDYPPPHQSISTLSYPDTGPTGYAFGFKVSARPGLWNSYIVDAEGTHPLSPHWFSGITMHAFHDTEPRMLAATGREVIEIDLRTRTWQARRFDKAVRSACHFEAGLAILLQDELLLVDSLDGEPTHRAATETRSAEMGSFHGRRVLCVPVGTDGNVFLVRRDGQLFVVGVLTAEVSGYSSSPDGEFLHSADGALAMSNWDSAIAAATVWSGEPLSELTEPMVTICE